MLLHVAAMTAFFLAASAVVAALVIAGVTALLHDVEQFDDEP